MAVVSPIPRISAASFTAKPRCHCEQYAQLAAGQAIELCKGLTGKRWHDKWVLHEDRCCRGKSATHIPALPACQRKNGGNKTRLFRLRKSKRKTAVWHFRLIDTGLIDGFGKRGARSAINGAKAIVLDAQRIARLYLALRRAVHEDDSAMSVRQIDSRS